MNEPNPQATSNTWKPLIALGSLTLICCMGFLCYFVALFVAVDQNINLIPPPSLNLNCNEAGCLKVCIQRLPEFQIQSLGNHGVELSNKPDGYELARYRLNEKTGQLDKLVTPTIPDYLKPYQDDIALHQRIWKYFTKIYPNIPEAHVAYMVVSMNNARERFSARVWEMEGKWHLNVNLFDFDSPQNVIETLTHEYGHLVTLNRMQIQDLHDEYGLDMEQVAFDKMHEECKDLFFTGFNCARQNAYLNAFGNRFWNGEIYASWAKIFLMADNDTDNYRKALSEFYSKYANQFVTEYAATNPREDIAESWTEFILRSKPTGSSIANQKVLFFYDYPELVQTREQIIHGICQSAVDQK